MPSSPRLALRALRRSRWTRNFGYGTLEANGLNVSDLGRILGSQPTASLILARRREMSKAVIRKLADHFGVNPGLFLRTREEAA